MHALGDHCKVVYTSEICIEEELCVVTVVKVSNAAVQPRAMMVLQK